MRGHPNGPGRRRARHLALRVAACSLVAVVYGGEAVQAQTRVTRRDSSGIAIYEVHGLGPRRAATRILLIGAVDGPPETTFFRIDDARFGPGGTLVVLDGGDDVVDVFDASGAHRATFGGRGEGPSEFANAWKLAIRADTVHVLDISLHKIASFDTSGRLLATRRIGYSVSGHGFPDAFVSRSNGRLYVVSLHGCGFPRRPHDNVWGLYGTDSQGAVDDTLRRQRVRNALPVYLSQGRSRSCTVAPWPFAPGPSVALDPSGGGFWSAGDAFEVHRLDASLTEVTAITRWVVPPRPVTAAHRRAFEDLLDVREELDRDLRRAVESAADSAGFPDAWPAISALRVAGPGVVWAQRVHPIGAAQQEWDVLADGRHVGTVVLPGDLRVTDVRDDRILGVVTDDLDVEYVAVYRVNR